MVGPAVAKSSRRIAAGRLNRLKRGPLSAEGIERLRQAAFRTQPWRHSTGPRSFEGKAQCVVNGKRRQLGPLSVREVRAEAVQIRAMIAVMRDARRRLT
jgi:hypothetical protein